jgi:hypothetical protein
MAGIGEVKKSGLTRIGISEATDLQKIRGSCSFCLLVLLPTVFKYQTLTDLYGIMDTDFFLFTSVTSQF